jgi:hypothetical protein
MHDLISRLSEQQIVDVILLLEEQNIQQAQTLLQAQFNLQPEQAQALLQAFAQQHDIKLDAQKYISTHPIQDIDVPEKHQGKVSLGVPEIGLIHTQASAIKMRKKMPNRILIGLIILVFVVILGLIFG